MEQTLKNWQIQQKIDSALGDRFDHIEDFTVSIRVPKGVQALEPPQDFLGLLQGGSPPLEVIIFGSTGQETLAEFQQVAVGKLNQAQKGPGQAAQPLPDQTVTTLYGNQLQMKLLGANSQRNLAPAGAAANSVPYFWHMYFAEEGSQKVMIAFLTPEAKFAEYQEAINLSLQTLALASKFSQAQSQGSPAAVPAGGAAPAAPGGAAPGGAAPAAPGGAGPAASGGAPPAPTTK
jgi:hypothetical protein